MQGEGYRQAAGGGEGKLGAAATHQRRGRSCKEGTAFERQAEGLRRAAGLVEPAHDLGAFAGLRGDEDRPAGNRQRLAELLGQGQGEGIDAERAIERLDSAVDGMADPWSVALGAAAGPISRSFDPRFAAILKDSL